MSKREWVRATLKEAILKLPVGADVVYIKSRISHTDPAIKDCWWVMSVAEEVIYHVSEYAYGPRVCKLVSPLYALPLDKQQKCEDRARRLLADSAVAPKNIKRLTYFDSDRTTLKSRFRYDHRPEQEAS